MSNRLSQVSLWLKCDENNNSDNLIDSSGNERHASQTDNPVNSNDVPFNSYMAGSRIFETNDPAYPRADFGSTNAISLTNAGGSLSWWGKFGTNSGHIFASGASSPKRFYFLNETIRIECNGGNIIGVTPPSINEWHHYCLVLGDFGIRFYIDGSQIAENESVISTGAWRYISSFSGNTNGVLTLGHLSDIREYQFSLTKEEIRILSNPMINNTIKFGNVF